MQESDIIDRIKALCEARSWSYYRLAKESGITYSTLCTMLHKVNAPSIPTLIKLCGGFGITLAEFFSPDSAAVLTPEQREHLRKWDSLSDANRTAAEKYLDFLLSGQQ